MIQDIGSIIGFLFVAFFAWLIFDEVNKNNGFTNPDFYKESFSGCLAPVFALIGALVVVFWLLE